LRRDSFLILFGRRLALPLFFSCAALLMQPCAAQWEFTGNLNVARDYQTATLLSNGKVLVASGATNGPQAFQYPQITSSELYDKATGTWTVTGSLNNGRGLHTATLLSGGIVLVAGGIDNGVILASAERFTPTGTPTPTPTPTATPTPASIQLKGSGKKVGGINTAHLKWRGATSANVDVYRDGNVIATTPNDGLYDDSTGTTGQGSFMYQVCEAGTQTCSNTVTVNFGP
jgi:hypothetical protein